MQNTSRPEMYGTGGGTRTHMMSLSTDFESVTFANSITPVNLHHYTKDRKKNQQSKKAINVYQGFGHK